VILVIDTSATVSAWAALLGDDRTGVEMISIVTEYANRSQQAITAQLERMIEDKTLTAVAVATGPGSFTGLRVGASFGLGLAMGLRIPIIPLPSLDLQAARSDIPATAVIEAGRGRLYYKVPGGEAMLGDPGDIPTAHPLAGNVAPPTQAALVAAGHRLIPLEPVSWAKAAARMLETAREVAYGSLKVEYMQSFSARPN
jgi:tRNA threonylcarbamoyl adenosine modification protein YeaZ